jgi:hypothetical protein
VCSVVVRFLRVEDLLYMGGIGAKGTPFIILFWISYKTVGYIAHCVRILFLADIFIPFFRVKLDECLHEIVTFLVFIDNDFDSA